MQLRKPYITRSSSYNLQIFGLKERKDKKHKIQNLQSSKQNFLKQKEHDWNFKNSMGGIKDTVVGRTNELKDVSKDIIYH